MVKFMSCAESRESFRRHDGSYTAWLSRAGLEALREVLDGCAEKGEDREAVEQVAWLALGRLGLNGVDRTMVAVKLVGEAFESADLRTRMAETYSEWAAS